MHPWNTADWEERGSLFTAVRCPVPSAGGGHPPQPPSRFPLKKRKELRAALLASFSLEEQVTLPGYIRGFLLSLLKSPAHSF